MAIADNRPSLVEPSAIGAVHRQIVLASLRLASLTLVVKIVGAGKDVFVARSFGASDEMDAFLIALAIPTYLITVLGGSLSSAFLPLYVQAGEQRGQLAARCLLGNSLGVACISLVAVAAILALLGDLILPIVAGEFDPEKLRLAKQLYYLLLATLVLSSLSLLLSASLNCVGRFTLCGIVPTLIPAATLLSLWLGREQLGVQALAFGTVIGYLLEFMTLVWATKRARLLSIRDLRPAVEQFRNLIRHAAPLVLSASLLGASGIIDQVMASTLDAGSVAALAYGNKIVSLVISVVVASLTTAVFPAFARMVALAQWPEIRTTLRNLLLIVLLIMVPVTAGLALTNSWLVRILFEGGEFTTATTNLVAPVQLGYLLQIPFYTMGVVAVRLLMAMGGNTAVLKIASLGLAFNVGGNFVLMQYFGVAGIALSTSLTYLGTTVMILLAVYRRLAQKQALIVVPRPHFVAHRKPTKI